MKKRMLGLLLAFAMVLGLTPTVVLAAGEIAAATNGRKITSTTTQDELNAWAGEGAIAITASEGVTTVRLLKNFDFPRGTMPITFGDVLNNPDAVMVLDLNGHSISSTTMVVVSGCNLTIRDSVGGGKISMDTSSNSKAAFSAVVNQEKLTIESGIFEAKIHESNPTAGVVGSAVAGVETVINGGTFSSSCSAINVSSGSTTVNGGIFTADTYGIVARGTAQVDFPANTQAVLTSDSFPIVVGAIGNNAGHVHISGGDFVGTNAANLVGKMGSVTPTDLVEISGGTFTNSPVGYVKTEKPIVNNGTSFMVGTDATALVKNAEAGDSLTLIQYNEEITVPEGVEIKNKTGNAVTVNGNTVADDQDITTTHSLVKTDAKVATCTEAGNIAYWYCRACDKYYSDEACTAETTLEATVIAATGHGEVEIKNVKDATCTEEGYTGDKFCKDCGEVIEQGMTLAKGVHTYKDGKCTVCGAAASDYQPGDVPQTGDNSDVAFWAVLMLVTGAGLIGTAVYSKRKKYDN